MTPPPELMQPLRLRRIPLSQLQARNALVQRVQDRPLAWAGQDWRLSIELGAPQEALDPADLWHARCQWAGGHFELWLPAEGARAWVQALYPLAAIPRLPPAYVQAVVQAALEALREQVDGLGRGAMQVESLRPWPHELPAPSQPGSGSRIDAGGHAHAGAQAETKAQAEAQAQGMAAGGAGPALEGDGRQVMDLVLRSAAPAGSVAPGAAGPQVLRVRLATDALGLVLLAALVAGHAPARNALDMDTVPVRLQAQIGVTWLSRRQLRKLAAADLVLMEQVLVTPERELWLAHAGWGLRVHWGDAGMTVLTEWSQGGFTMPEDLYAPQGQDAPHDLDALPLCLTFDLGEREITLGELRQLQVGQGIDLGVPLGGPVQMRVQGVLVARGDLIEVDGRLGVAITSLHGSLPPADTPERHGADAEGADPEDLEGDEGREGRALRGGYRDDDAQEEHLPPDADREIEPGAGGDADTSRAAELPTDA